MNQLKTFCKTVKRKEALRKLWKQLKETTSPETKILVLKIIKAELDIKL